MNPTISVILATHDRPESLLRAVQAVLAQTRPPEEVIVVNDGAEEISGQIGQMHRAAGVAFHHCRRDRPSLPASRNRGAGLARGDILLFLDDDVVLPGDYLRRLAELYDADTSGRIAGIGGVLVNSAHGKLAARLWWAIATFFAVNRWAPRVVAARYVAPAPGLGGRLAPARSLSGGAISLRREVAAVDRFAEDFTGYALGEDTEFAYRVGRRRPLFVAGELKARHEVAPNGRPDMRDRGRMYAANMLYILHNSVEPGVGTSLLFGYHLLGMALLHGGASLMSLRRRNLDFVLGLAGELLRAAGGRMRKALCGSS